MDMKRFLYLIWFTLPLLASAQERTDSLRREITIEKDFTPIVRDASKINTLPEVEKPTVTKQKIQYSDWTAPATLDSYGVLLSPTGFTTHAQQAQQRGYFDFALGNYWNMIGNAGYRILHNEKDRLGVWVQHRSTSGVVDYNQSLSGYPTQRQMRQLDDQAIVDYIHSFKQVDWGIRGGYRHNLFNYYGLCHNNLISNQQEINRFFLKSDVNSTRRESELYYRASLAYYRYDNRRGVLENKGADENLIDADFTLTAPIKQGQTIAVDGAVDYVNYNHLNQASDYVMLSLTPRYNWRNSHIALSAGVQADISFNEGTILRFSPQVRFDWNITPEAQLYTRISGGKELNTWHKVSECTLYFNPSQQVMNSYIPLDATLGVQINALPGLSLGISGGYETGKDILFAEPGKINSYLTGIVQFKGIDAQAFKATVDATYRYGSHLEASARINYQYWYNNDNRQILSFNRPQWEGTVNVRYLPIAPLSLEAGYEFAIGRGIPYNDSASYPDKHSVRVKASYSFAPWFSLYALTDNLLNCKYDILYGMPAQGIRVMAGVDFKF